MSHYRFWVQERLDAPVGKRSLCHVCPLNGQRKVGEDGPDDAQYVAIFEAPGADEESHLSTRGVPYGRPLQGRTGYYLRLRHLAHVGLQELLPNPRSPQSPRIGRLGVKLLNTIMCRPPDNKIDSPEGKAAQLCCGNSARWRLNTLYEADPNRTWLPAGATALSMLRGDKTAIEPYRGRPTMHTPPLAYIPEDEIYKKVLRGKKPKEEWWPSVESGMKHWIKYWRKVERTLGASLKKATQSAFLEANQWLTEWTKLWKKQKATLARQSRQAQSDGTPTPTAPRAPRKRKQHTETLPLLSETPTPPPETGRTPQPGS